MQIKQDEWAWQWAHMEDDNQWLFAEWIAPNTLETFRDKTVLDCGCGGGQHISFVAPYARKIVGVDLNAIETARERTKQFTNVELRTDDIAVMRLSEQYDIVYSIGVLHHTDDPDASFTNIARHCKIGGRVIVWVYAREGNFWNKFLLEPMKTVCIRWLPRPVVMGLAHLFTALLYIPIYTIYLLPLPFLPFFEYFDNWRHLSYRRNLLNVFDKLNAPQTWFITQAQIESWFDSQQFTDIHISPYKGVSWRGSGTRR